MLCDALVPKKPPEFTTNCAEQQLKCGLAYTQQTCGMVPSPCMLPAPCVGFGTKLAPAATTMRVRPEHKRKHDEHTDTCTDKTTKRQGIAFHGEIEVRICSCTGGSVVQHDIASSGDLPLCWCADSQITVNVQLKSKRCDAQTCFCVVYRCVAVQEDRISRSRRQELNTTTA